MVDFRLYLELEAALHRKLSRAWRPAASELFSHLNDLVKANQFEAAHELITEISFVEAGKSCKQYIKYVLQACINFGGAMARGNDAGKPFVTVSNHDKLLDQVTANFLLTLEYNVTEVTKNFAMQSIAKAEAAYLTTQKADEARFVKDFVSFQKTGDEMLQLVSSLHSSRLSTWGFAAEADLMGFTEYQLTAVLDGRTSEFCRAINGKRFKVKDASEFVNRVLRVENPDDVKAVQPWPKQDKASIEDFRTMDSEALTQLGLHIPPYHPKCRTLCTRVGHAPATQMKEVPPEMQSIPKSLSTQETFKEMGMPATAAEVAHWNDFVGLSPVTVLSKISSVTPKDLLDGELGSLGKAIQFKSNGDIAFSLTKKLVGAKKLGKYSMSAVYDPYAGVMYSTQAEFMAANPADSLRFLRNLYAGLADVGQSIGASTLSVAAEGGVAVSAYTSSGFLPSPAGWFNLKSDIQAGIAADAYPALGTLTEAQSKVVADLLGNRNEQALATLLSLPFTVEGIPVGQYLLSDAALDLSLNLADKAAISLLKGATA